MVCQLDNELARNPTVQYASQEGLHEIVVRHVRTLTQACLSCLPPTSRPFEIEYLPSCSSDQFPVFL